MHKWRNKNYNIFVHQKYIIILSNLFINVRKKWNKIQKSCTNDAKKLMYIGWRSCTSCVFNYLCWFFNGYLAFLNANVLVWYDIVLGCWTPHRCTSYYELHREYPVYNEEINTVPFIPNPPSPPLIKAQIWVFGLPTL